MTKEEKKAAKLVAANPEAVVANLAPAIIPEEVADVFDDDEEEVKVNVRTNSSGKRISTSGMVQVALIKAWHKDGDLEAGLKEKFALIGLNSGIEYDFRIGSKIIKTRKDDIRALTLSEEQLKNLCANSGIVAKNIPESIAKLAKLARPRATAKGVEYATLLFDVLLEEGKEPSEASIIPSQIIMGESAQERRDRQEDLLLQEKIRQGLVDSLEDFE